MSNHKRKPLSTVALEAACTAMDVATRGAMSSRDMELLEAKTLLRDANASVPLVNGVLDALDAYLLDFSDESLSLLRHQRDLARIYWPE
ncbi:MAG TPA: hypothetical protein VK150_06955 [Geothrix sp.]|nr:hypothetical protein [Geothrix sp.]